MDLEEFRERTRRGERPLDGSLEKSIEYFRALFEVSVAYCKNKGMIGGFVRLDLNNKEERIFFDWLTSEMYDAYMLYDKIEPFVLSKHLKRDVAESIVLMPKKATREEIELSLGSKFR